MLQRRAESRPGRQRRLAPCRRVGSLSFMGFLFNWFRSNVYIEPRTGIEFPESVGPCKRGETTEYEVEPGKRGVAIEYRSADIEATVYVHALEDEDRKTAANCLEGSLAAVKEFEARGMYSKVKIFELAAEKEIPGWKSAAFTSSSTNHFILSFIHCKVVSGRLVKIRATTGSPTNEVLQSFTTNLQQIVDRPAKKP